MRTRLAEALYAKADDTTMADTVEQVAERLTLLEVTVARGFHDMEQRFASMSRKIATAREILRQSLLNHGERRQLLRIRGIR